MSHTYTSTSPPPQGFTSPSSYAPTPTSASPAESTPASSTTSLPSISSSKPKQKPVNIFTNDGSFLERIQRSKMEEQDKKKAKEDIERKINFENRFKNRGKRKIPPPQDRDIASTVNTSSPGTSNAADTSMNQITPEEPPTKKAKSNNPTDNYQQQLRKYETSKGGLADSGTGVRPLVK